MDWIETLKVAGGRWRVVHYLITDCADPETQWDQSMRRILLDVVERNHFAVLELLLIWTQSREFKREELVKRMNP